MLATLEDVEWIYLAQDRQNAVKRQWTFGFHKSRGISVLAERLSDFQKSLWGMQLLLSSLQRIEYLLINICLINRSPVMKPRRKISLD